MAGSLSELIDRIRDAYPNPVPLTDLEMAMLAAYLETPAPKSNSPLTDALPLIALTSISPFSVIGALAEVPLPEKLEYTLAFNRRMRSALLGKATSGCEILAAAFDELVALLSEMHEQIHKEGRADSDHLAFLLRNRRNTWPAQVRRFYELCSVLLTDKGEWAWFLELALVQADKWITEAAPPDNAEGYEPNRIWCEFHVLGSLSGLGPNLKEEWSQTGVQPTPTEAPAVACENQNNLPPVLAKAFEALDAWMRLAKPDPHNWPEDYCLELYILLRDLGAELRFAGMEHAADRLLASGAHRDPRLTGPSALAREMLGVIDLCGAPQVAAFDIFRREHNESWNWFHDARRLIARLPSQLQEEKASDPADNGRHNSTSLDETNACLTPSQSDKGTGTMPDESGQESNPQAIPSVPLAAALERLGIPCGIRLGIPGGPAGRPLMNLDTVDFTVILAIAKPLLATLRRFAEWEHDGFIGDFGGDLALQACKQWTALESALAAAGLADRTAVWQVGDKLRENAARALRDLACDVRRGRLPGYWVQSQGDCEIILNENDGPHMSFSLLSKRLGVVVEMLEELQRGRPLGEDVTLDQVPASTGQRQQDQAIPLSNPPDLFLEFTTTQRKLLTALEGKGKVPIEDVLRAVYGGPFREKLDALFKLKDRTNEALSRNRPSLEIKKEGETLSLATV